MLADMVHHLKNLQIFKFYRDCTDEIIEQLQRHCPHLMELDVSYSRDVTNASVQHLIEARKLKLLYLEGTGIDDEHYAMILSELPNITNITFQKNATCFLRQIAVERLYTVRHVSGFIRDIETVAHKCPNTTNITMYHPTVNLSGLTAFNALSALTIEGLHYGNSDLKAVLQGAGHRLTELKLYHLEGLVLQDIITLCPSLAHLSLTYCEFLNLNLNTQLDPQLPHFRNLITLEVGHLEGTPNIWRFIRYYLSLKTIHFIDISCFNVQLVSDILNQGTYKQLEILRVEEFYRHEIDVDALQLLTAHCPLLKRIEHEGGINFGHESLGELKRQIQLQNLDLKFKEV
jgi:hypothetical protein